MKLLIGIPAYNEETVISGVVKSIPRKITGISHVDILVVDDGSSDNTGRESQKAGAYVARHLLNRGLGGALKTVFAYARQKDYDILVTFDADGQHQPLDIYKMIEPILKEKKDVIIGSRWKNKRKDPMARFIVNQIANLVTFLLFGIYSTDSQSGLRAFSSTAIKKINVQTDGMEVSSEFFKEIYRNKLAFAEISIKPIYTDYSLSKGQKLTNAVKVVSQLLLRFLR